MPLASTRSTSKAETFSPSTYVGSSDSRKLATSLHPGQPHCISLSRTSWVGKVIRALGCGIRGHRRTHCQYLVRMNLAEILRILCHASRAPKRSRGDHCRGCTSPSIGPYKTVLSPRRVPARLCHTNAHERRASTLAIRQVVPLQSYRRRSRAESCTRR